MLGKEKLGMDTNSIRNKWRKGGVVVYCFKCTKLT